MEVKNSALCVIDRYLFQTDFFRNQTNDYYPLINVASGSSIEFTIPGSSEECIDVNDIQLYILAKVSKADGSDERRISGIQQLAHIDLVSRCESDARRDSN